MSFSLKHSRSANVWISCPLCLVSSGGFSYAVRLCMWGGGEASGLEGGMSAAWMESPGREEAWNTSAGQGMAWSSGRSSAWSRLYSTALQTVNPQHFFLGGGVRSPKEGTSGSLLASLSYYQGLSSLGPPRALISFLRLLE